MTYDEYFAIFIRSCMVIKGHLAPMNSTGNNNSDYYSNEKNEGHILISLYNYGKMSFPYKRSLR